MKNPFDNIKEPTPSWKHRPHPIMTEAQRIQNIEDWLHQQRHLHGLMFRILPEDDDNFIIEFASATQRQLITLNRSLITDGMTHIRSRALKVIDYQNHIPKKK